MTKKWLAEIEKKEQEAKATYAAAQNEAEKAKEVTLAAELEARKAEEVHVAAEEKAKKAREAQSGANGEEVAKAKKMTLAAEEATKKTEEVHVAAEEKAKNARKAQIAAEKKVETAKQAHVVAEEEAEKAREEKIAIDSDIKKAKDAQQAAEEEVRKAKEAQNAAEEETKKARETSIAVEEKLKELEEGVAAPQKVMQEIRTEIKTSRTWYIFGAIALAILLIILYVFSPGGQVLKGLRDVDYARGLITFIFSLGTIGIGIILTLAALRPGEEEGKAFARGKEIFTILVGILGTIVGFYFGSGTEELSTGEQLIIAETKVSDLQPQESKKVDLFANITGGKPPYNVSVNFSPDIIDPIEIDNNSGEFRSSIQIPGVEKDTPLIIRVTASDRGGSKTEAVVEGVLIKNADEKQSGEPAPTTGE